ncbi:hypothetical protein NE857_21515 [Nocardiopsis exhalans]|uniref:Uncharacterized protein n=1 Tax=Nocardiopsis exhalans TaxID=163604 RepID=A0ABY5D0R5_9ACTN|nr:hypothetical protein [Nocardiopsis exhalans]USY17896.1 hypothetical protein NE857_21515 [Nocardiopsis exhalans]
MPEPTAYTHDQIAVALNRASADISEAASLPDEGTIDALNLLVNAAIHYLEHPGDGLAEVVEADYDATTLDKVLGWISS